MTRKLVRAGLFAAAAVGFVVGAGALTAQDKDKEEKAYEISEIMKKGHGAKGLLKGIGAHVKAGEWDEAKTDAELLKAFGTALGKNKPDKGDTKSWEKLTKAYKENTENVYKAVVKKDAKAANDNLGKIGKSCKGCHDSHKS